MKLNNKINRDKENKINIDDFINKAYLYREISNFSPNTNKYSNNKKQIKYHFQVK